MSISLWLIKKMRRRRVFYDMVSRGKKRLFDAMSVLYMFFYYATLIGFIYNILFALTRFINWILVKCNVTNALNHFLAGWPSILLNIFFPVMIIGFFFNIILDVWVGDLNFFRETFKYRVMRF